MNKYEKIYQKAYKKSANVVSWIAAVLVPLAVDLEEYTGLPVDFYGPYGLRAAVTFSVGNKHTTITANFHEESIKLFYDTGNVTYRFAPDTIGGINDFNNIVAPLPDSFEEIVKIFTQEKGSEIE